MKIAITGFANSGKTTVFGALTGRKMETTPYPTAGGEPVVGVVRVPDLRLERLNEFFGRKKTVYATVEYVDFMGLVKGDLNHNRKVFEHIYDSDALMHVVRAFRDDSVVHPAGTVDSVRDAKDFELELVVGDLDLVEKRIERIKEAEKKGQKPSEAEMHGLLKLKSSLEEGIPLRGLSLAEDELKAVRHLRFLSLKPEVAALNVGEDEMGTEETEGLVADVGASLKGGVTVTSLSGKLEREIAELQPSEAREFLDALGIEEPARSRIIGLSYGFMGLISFFTVGSDEVRAWTVKKGTSALKAAGKVHSDMERGFIRAEVVSYEDFVSSGGMHEAREKGLFRLEGKEYLVKDGDVINFRFNV